MSDITVIDLGPTGPGDNGHAGDKLLEAQVFDL
jgi:hypothetical protein